MLLTFYALVTVIIGNKNINYGKKILSEFIFGYSALIMNYDLNSSFFKNLLNKFKFKATEFVLVGNYNVLEFTFESSFQKGGNPFSFS